MFTKFSAASLVVASLAATVFAENKYNHTNGGVQNKASDCKLGSGKILDACGTCAQAITDCAVNAEETYCLKDIKDMAIGCGGCAVDILQCL